MRASIASESRDYVDHYWEKGYAVVRGLFSKGRMAEVQNETRRLYAEGLKHHATYRHKNLFFEILPEHFAGQRFVLQAHWFAWISPFFEELRRDPAYLSLLEPLLGRDIKQIAQQIHWKPPGANLTGFRFHQDLRFRERQDLFADVMTSYVTTGLAIDPATRENGCLRVVPESHKRGYLGLSDEGGALMKGATAGAELEAVGLDPSDIVDLELEPGDVALWSLLTVHGSQPNHSDHDRAFGLSSYARADKAERGEWAFRDGRPVPLGEEAESLQVRSPARETRPLLSRRSLVHGLTGVWRGAMQPIDISPLFQTDADRAPVEAQIAEGAYDLGFLLLSGLPDWAVMTAKRRRCLTAVFDLPDAEKRRLTRRRHVPGNPNLYRGFEMLGRSYRPDSERVDVGPDCRRSNTSNWCEASSAGSHTLASGGAATWLEK